MSSSSDFRALLRADDHSKPVNAALLKTDILFMIFSKAAEADQPVLCSCTRHAPTPTELRQQACCDDFPQCHDWTACIFGKSMDPFNCVYNLGWVNLGHVCRLWRSVLKGMSNLWANDLCTVNNSALVEFLAYAGTSPLTIDLTPRKVQNMLHPAKRRERVDVHFAPARRSLWRVRETKVRSRNNCRRR